MWPGVALSCNEREALVFSRVTGYRASVERKLFSKKSGFTTSCLAQSKNFGERAHSSKCSGEPAMESDGRLLEWQAMQFSAKTILPRSSKAGSAVRNCAPPGASL